MILAIDPGPKESAYLTFDGHGHVDRGTVSNEQLLEMLRRNAFGYVSPLYVAIEWIVGYGLTVGMETFETCRWVGRFEQAAGGATLVNRKIIKSHLCANTQAKDQHVRQALIGRFGPPGTKKKPGPTYGITGHEWSALAVAVWYWDTHKEAP